MIPYDFSQPPPDLPLDNPLWRTSVQLWNDEHIAASCLALQASGYSVSRILTAIWLTAQDVAWDGTEPEAIQQWRRDYTEVYRQLRTGLSKNNAASATLRKETQAAELTAEKIELAWIYHELTTKNVKLFKIFSSNENHTRYNAALLFANLNVAAPDVSTSLQGEHGMTQLINKLMGADDAATEYSLKLQREDSR